MPRIRRSAERQFRDNLVCELWAFGQRKGFLLPPHGVSVEEERAYDRGVAREFVRELLTLADYLPDPRYCADEADLLEKIEYLLIRCKSALLRETPSVEIAAIVKKSLP